VPEISRRWDLSRVIKLARIFQTRTGAAEAGDQEEAVAKEEGLQLISHVPFQRGSTARSDGRRSISECDHVDWCEPAFIHCRAAIARATMLADSKSLVGRFIGASLARHSRSDPAGLAQTSPELAAIRRSLTRSRTKRKASPRAGSVALTGRILIHW